MTKKALLTFLSIIGISLFGKAQMDLTLYNMPDVPQSMHVNPSHTPEYNFYIGIPGLSSLHLHHQNTVFNPFHLFEQVNGVTTVRTAHFMDRVGKNNTLGFESSIELLSFGFKAKKNYFHFSLKDRAATSIYLPKDLLLFPVTGNGRFDQLTDNSLDFSGLSIDLNHYTEYAFGWQRPLNDQWSVGVRLKYLKGLENVRTQNSNVIWKTDPVTYDWTFSGDMQIFTSGFADLIDTLDNNSLIEQEKYKEYYTSKKNNGIGIDLGATYTLNERTDLSFSLIDFGFIQWKTNNQNYVSTNGEFIFTGLQLSADMYGADSTVTDSIQVVLDALQADIENNFGYEENTVKYKTALRSRVYLNANYKLYERSKTSGSLGITAQGKIRNKHISPSFSVSYNQKVGKWLSASASYSIINKDYRNLGAGLRLNGGPFQWYITVDNLMPLVFTEIDFGPERTEVVRYPSFSENMLIHTGFNLTFGGSKKDADGDGIPDKKDKCPDVPGLKEFDGCPDTDGDGISDSEDECPNDAGPKELMGCPDRDGDTVIDKKDVCPDLAGPVENSGCPDKDKDGVMDNEDDCPDEAGPVENKGCPWPDTDNDTVLDKDDKCPEVAGVPENDGCPLDDRDSDGVVNDEDRCPDTAGPASNQGCPLKDSDSDGVPDVDDECPNTYGSKENKGCPLVSKEDQAILAETFSNVEFKSNTAIITQESYPAIDNLLTILERHPDWRLKIAGHTDSIGTEEANMRLSQKRAQAVADLLMARGVSRGRLHVIGYGESQPIESNMYHPGRQKNRRVELSFEFD